MKYYVTIKSDFNSILKNLKDGREYELNIKETKTSKNKRLKKKS